MSVPLMALRQLKCWSSILKRSYSKVDCNSPTYVPHVDWFNIGDLRRCFELNGPYCSATEG